MKDVLKVNYGRNVHEKFRKYIFWAIFGDMYRYTLNQYRYSLGSGRFWPTCTGTCQTCTGTPCFVLTSVRILAITCSFLSDLSDSSG